MLTRFVLLTPIFFKSRSDGFYHFAHIICRSMFILSGLNIKVTGIENIPKNENFVIAANHQSLMDILFMVALMNQLVIITQKLTQMIPVVIVQNNTTIVMKFV